jgi:hypothetical protein
MESDKPDAKPTRRSIGRAVSKSAKALEALKKAEAERREAARLRMAKLAQEASVENALLRKAEAERRRKREALMANRLGRMVLAALRRQGQTGTLLAASDLKGLSTAHRQMLEEVLRASSEEATPAGQEPTLPTTSATLDIDLGD